MVQQTVEREVIIGAPLETVFQFWLNFQRFATLLDDVRRVDLLDDACSQWEVAAPFNTTVAFVATTKRVESNTLIEWASEHGAGLDTVESGGTLTFARTDHDPVQTRVALHFHFDIPTAAAQQVVGMLRALGYPDRAFDRNLQQIKTLIEAEMSVT
ncbi:MAG: hypothetical protein RhofKO_25200 [Rhodothermales bacterium]